MRRGLATLSVLQHRIRPLVPIGVTGLALILFVPVVILGMSSPIIFGFVALAAIAHESTTNVFPCWLLSLGLHLDNAIIFIFIVRGGHPSLVALGPRCSRMPASALAKGVTLRRYAWIMLYRLLLGYSASIRHHRSTTNDSVSSPKRNLAKRYSYCSNKNEAPSCRPS